MAWADLSGARPALSWYRGAKLDVRHRPRSRHRSRLCPVILAICATACPNTGHEARSIGTPQVAQQEARRLRGGDASPRAARGSPDNPAGSTGASNPECDQRQRQIDDLECKAAAGHVSDVAGGHETWLVHERGIYKTCMENRHPGWMRETRMSQHESAPGVPDPIYDAALETERGQALLSQVGAPCLPVDSGVPSAADCLHSHLDEIAQEICAARARRAAGIGNAQPLVDSQATAAAECVRKLLSASPPPRPHPPSGAVDR